MSDEYRSRLLSVTPYDTQLNKVKERQSAQKVFASVASVQKSLYHNGTLIVRSPVIYQ